VSRALPIILLALAVWFTLAVVTIALWNIAKRAVQRRQRVKR
jgi:flagellar basal body-associated protein FliL